VYMNWLVDMNWFVGMNWLVDIGTCTDIVAAYFIRLASLQQTY